MQLTKIQLWNLIIIVFASSACADLYTGTAADFSKEWKE